MIEIKNIFKSFGKSEVLHDISAKFERGKTNLIIGQSGSGKTVLLKCLLGLYPINKGELIYEAPKINEIREYSKENLSYFWDELKRLENPQQYYVDYSKKLYNLKLELIKSSKK